jgi:hypothetical protein
VKLIETQTLGTAAASVTFSSIPQTFTDLRILVSARSNAAGYDNVFLRINGDSTSQYASRNLRAGSGSTNPFTENITSGSQALDYANISTAQDTANTFGSVDIYIPNYTSTVAKSLFAESAAETNGTVTYVLTLVASRYAGTSPATSLVVQCFSQFIAGSTFSLYGITKGSDGIVTTSP